MQAVSLDGSMSLALRKPDRIPPRPALSGRGTRQPTMAGGRIRLTSGVPCCFGVYAPMPPFPGPTSGGIFGLAKSAWPHGSCPARDTPCRGPWALAPASFGKVKAMFLAHAPTTTTYSTAARMLRVALGAACAQPAFASPCSRLNAMFSAGLSYHPRWITAARCLTNGAR